MLLRRQTFKIQIRGGKIAAMETNAGKGAWEKEEGGGEGGANGNNRRPDTLWRQWT